MLGLTIGSGFRVWDKYGLGYRLGYGLGYRLGCGLGRRLGHE